MRALKWLDENLEEFFLLILLFLMVAVMGVQITMRYVFNSSLVWSEEFTRYCFIWSTFLSLGFCIKRGISIKIDQFTTMIPEKSIVRRIIELLVKIIMLVFFVYLFRYSLNVVEAAIASGQKSPAMGTPMYMIQVSTAIGFFLAVIRCIQSVFKELKSFRAVKPLK